MTQIYFNTLSGKRDNFYWSRKDIPTPLNSREPQNKILSKKGIFVFLSLNSLAAFQRQRRRQVNGIRRTKEPGNKATKFSHRTQLTWKPTTDDLRQTKKKKKNSIQTLCTHLHYYLTHWWGILGSSHSFPKSISLKVNVIARLEFELASHDVVV